MHYSTKAAGDSFAFALALTFPVLRLVDLHVLRDTQEPDHLFHVRVAQMDLCTLGMAAAQWSA